MKASARTRYEKMHRRYVIALFLLVAVSMVVISALAGGISFWTVLDALAFLAVAVALFSRDRGQFATIAFAFLALVALFLFFRRRAGLVCGP